MGAFEEILNRHRVRVYRICYRMAGNADDAEDWAQECFVRAWTQLKSFDVNRKFEPWLLRVTSNTCINLSKSRTNQRSRVSPISLEDHVIPTSSTSGPHEKLMNKATRQAIQEVMTHVSPVLRQAVALWAMEELTFKELAEALGVPLTTAAQRVRRGLIQVRRRLARQGFEVK